MTNLLTKDVAQEAHISNKDTWDSCQDGKRIKDVSKQSAKPRNRGVFFFKLSAFMRFTPPGLCAVTRPTFLRAASMAATLSATAGRC